MTRAPSAIYGPGPKGPETYRYLLSWPTGLDNDRRALGIFANPSTATEFKTDPTVAKWVRYCRAWRYGWADVCNVRAWRETDPRRVPKDDAIAEGPENVRWMTKAIDRAEIVVCGWGNLGGELGNEVAYWLSSIADGKLFTLGLNKNCSPKHPLYLRGDATPRRWF